MPAHRYRPRPPPSDAISASNPGAGAASSGRCRRARRRSAREVQLLRRTEGGELRRLDEALDLAARGIEAIGKHRQQGASVLPDHHLEIVEHLLAPSDVQLRL